MSRSLAASASHRLIAARSLTPGRRKPPRAALWMVALFVVSALTLSVTTAAMARTSAGAPLTVVVLGKGATVTSTPAGISCPARCTATFSAGTRVVLAPHLKGGFRLLRWAGGCKGSGGCALKVSSPTAVTVEFVSAPGTKATPARSSKPSNTKPSATPPSKSVAEPGSYSINSNSYNWFSVGIGSKKVQNIYIGVGAPIACVPAATGAPTTNPFLVPAATIAPNGAFTGKFSQRGIFDGSPATFTYSFAGRFTAATAAVPANAAGSYREDIVFRDNVTHHCTTNDQSWKATKSGPIPQKTSLVRAGDYHVNSNTYNTFSVAVGNASVQNVSIGVGVSIACTPTESGVPMTDHIVISQARIMPDGSFTGTSTQTGVFAGAPAKITYWFAGNFQGLDRYGRTTAYGTLRADIAFNDSAGSHSCTSNTLPWYAGL